MRHISIVRAFLFSFVLYAFTFLLFALVLFAFRLHIGTPSEQIPVHVCLVYFVLTIPLVLMLAKWYFRKFQPSFKRGIFLGIFTLVIFYTLDTVMLFSEYPRQEALSLLSEMVVNWKFYTLILVVLGTTAYAGFEFDRTYTFDEAGLKKK